MVHMCPQTNKTGKSNISIDEIKIPTDSTKDIPKKGDNICALWVFQNCAGEKEQKLRRIVSLVRNRNSINWLPVTTDGTICIVTFIGEFSNLIKLRSSVFGLGMESFSFKIDAFWIIPPNDMTQFIGFFKTIKSDLQSREKITSTKRTRNQIKRSQSISKRF